MTDSTDSMDERSLYAAVLGQVIRGIRGRTSQEELARCAVLSKSALSRFEGGQTIPDLHEVRRIALALGVDLAEFCQVVERTLSRARDVIQGVGAGIGTWDVASIAGAARALQLRAAAPPTQRRRRGGSSKTRQAP